ncbi:MAG: Hpt domain-containing protein [Nitrosopumilaceae archaeon]
MSDNFLKIARKEIQEELDGLEQILARCSDDIDISYNAQQIEKHLHKIKGLAPMMGQKDIGDIANMAETLAKYVIANGMLAGAYQILVESNHVMEEIFNGTTTLNVSEFKNKLRQTFPDLLDH